MRVAITFVAGRIVFLHTPMQSWAMQIEVKTCGLTDETSVDVASAAGATHLGFVHFERSPRHLDIATMRRLVRHMRDGGTPSDGYALSVVVTVNADDATLDRIMGEVAPDMLQLHGRETPERAAELRDRYGAWGSGRAAGAGGVGLVRALSVRTADDLARARAFEPVVDRILFDAGASQPTALPGGNGTTFDWSLLRDWNGGPFWLAGGLNAGNVVRAIETVRPRGIDLSSALESAPGVKDPTKIRALFEILNAHVRIGHVTDWRWEEPAGRMHREAAE